MPRGLIVCMLFVAAAVPTRAKAQQSEAALRCDGRRDVTAALNEVLATGGEVHLPPGVCIVSGSVLIVSGTTLTGAGRAATTIRSAPGAAYPTLSIGRARASQGSRNVDISALAIDGGAKTRGRRASDGIQVAWPSNHVRIHDVAVTNAGDNGIEVNGSNVDVTDSFVHDNWTNGIYVIGTSRYGAVPPRRAARIRILRNRVIHNSLANIPPSRGSTWDGIDADPITADVLVQENTVIGNDIICLENGRDVASSGPFRVVGNVVIDSPENGVDMTGPLVDFEVSGNRIERVLGWGVVVNGPAHEGIIRGNAIRGTSAAGIMIHNATSLPGVPSDIVVSGNTIAPGPSAAQAIGVDQGAINVRVVGNRLILRPGVPALATHGAGTGLVVQDNR